MQINSKLKIPLLILLFSIIIEIDLMIDNNMKIGHIISYAFPCKTPPGNSFPCYGIYNIYLIIGFLILIFGSIGFIVDIHYGPKNIKEQTIFNKITRLVISALYVGFIAFIGWMIFAFIFLR